MCRMRTVAVSVPAKQAHMLGSPPQLARWSSTWLTLWHQCLPTLAQVLQHQEGVSCSAWHPSRPLHLATTSHSGVVRTWDLNSDSGSSAAPLAALEGHTRRSFGVSWSPLVPQLLLSASDDGTARVWDVDAGCCLSVLAGHSSRVRALCWHPDLPWLVFTGEWVAIRAIGGEQDGLNERRFARSLRSVCYALSTAGQSAHQWCVPLSSQAPQEVVAPCVFAQALLCILACRELGCQHSQLGLAPQPATAGVS
jgi:hypothetical protein